MEHLSFPFKTSLQCILETRQQLPQLEELFDLLRCEGFYGVELNLPDLGLMNPGELKTLLDRHHLKMDMLATGVYARQRGLSLSSAEPLARTKAVRGCMDNIDYAASIGCGIILGFFKGGPGGDMDTSVNYFLESMEKLKPYIEQKKVPVLIEATNHKETSIIKTLAEGARITDILGSPYIQLLADTYHMNIEEPSVLDSLEQYKDYYPHLHISDDNRAFPGLGSMDFPAIYRRLVQIGYRGTLAVEGNIQASWLEDTRRSAAYLHGACRGISVMVS